MHLNKIKYLFYKPLHHANMYPLKYQHMLFSSTILSTTNSELCHCSAQNATMQLAMSLSGYHYLDFAQHALSAQQYAGSDL